MDSKMKKKNSNTPEGKLRKQEEKAQRAKVKKARADELETLRIEAFKKRLEKQAHPYEKKEKEKFKQLEFA
jgi:hypothetical protein